MKMENEFMNIFIRIKYLTIAKRVDIQMKVQHI